MNNNYKVGKSSTIIGRMVASLLLCSFIAGLPEARGQAETQKSNMRQEINSSAVTFTDFLAGKNKIHVLSSGTIGNAPLLMIRGISSINLNASPTILVDGIPVRYTRSLPSFLSIYEPVRFAFVNPNDIRDMSVLTGGPLLSNTGGRGSNGALRINTDRGELGGTKIDFTARFGLLTADYEFPIMDSPTFRGYLYDYLLENGISENVINAIPIFDSSLPQYNNQTNWLDMITRNAAFNDYHLKLKGGDGDAGYMFSIGYTSKEETIKESELERINMRFNLDYKLSPKIDIFNSLSYSNMTSRYAEQGFNYGIHPVYTALTKAPFMSPYVYSESGLQTKQIAYVDMLEKSNPLALIHNLENKNEENRVDGLISAGWQIQGAHSIHASLAFSYFNLKEKQYRPSLGIINDLNRIRQNSERTSSEFMIYWNGWYESFGKINENISYKVNAGFTVDSREEKSVFIRKINAGTDDYETLRQGTVDSTSNTRISTNLMSVYANGTFDLNDKVTIDANINIEGSSNFGTEGRWGTYAGLKATADLLKRTNKTRVAVIGSWTRTGNHDLRSYHHYNLYNSVNYFGYGGVYLANVANPEIRPEVTHTLDGGLLLHLFDSRISIDGGYYYKKTTDLITQKSMPIEIGLDPQLENSGSIISQGVEINADIHIIRNSNFNWSVSGNLSTLKNKVDKLYNGNVIRSLGGIKTIACENEPVGSFYGYRLQGVFKTEADVDLMKPDGTYYNPGDYRVVDVNGDHKINDNDLQIIGSPLPKLFGGFGTRTGWKRLNLDAWFSYSYGNDIYNRFNQQMHLMKDFSNQSVEVLNRWISESDQGTGLSRASYDDPSANGSPSDRWVEDGSFVKLKNITLAYDVPLGRIRTLNRLQIWITGENLIVITPYSGYDPEFVSSSDPMSRGIDFGTSPVPKSLIIGLKLSF